MGRVRVGHVNVNVNLRVTCTHHWPTNNKSVILITPLIQHRCIRKRQIETHCNYEQKRISVLGTLLIVMTIITHQTRINVMTSFWRSFFKTLWSAINLKILVNYLSIYTYGSSAYQKWSNSSYTTVPEIYEWSCIYRNKKFSKKTRYGVLEQYVLSNLVPLYSIGSSIIQEILRSDQYSVETGMEQAFFHDDRFEAW